MIETRRTGERGARVEEPRAWSDVTRRSRARERDRPANPNEGEDRERGRRREREKEGEKANWYTREQRHATTRKRRHACDPSRGTATTEPFQTSTSRRAPPSSRSPRRSEPSCRPATSPSHYSLFLSRSRSPSVYRLSFFLPPLRRSDNFHPFLFRYSRSSSFYAGYVDSDRFRFYLPSVSLHPPSPLSRNRFVFPVLVSIIRPQVNIEVSSRGKYAWI